MSRVPQKPGCLPAGYTRDSMLTLDQFVLWQQTTLRKARALVPSMKGVNYRSRQDITVHVGTYLDGTIKK